MESEIGVGAGLGGAGSGGGGECSRPSPIYPGMRPAHWLMPLPGEGQSQPSGEIRTFLVLVMWLWVVGLGVASNCSLLFGFSLTHVCVLHSFLFRVVFHCKDTPQFIYPSTSSWTFGSLTVWGHYKVNIYEHCVLGILGGSGKYIFSFLLGKYLRVEF